MIGVKQLPVLLVMLFLSATLVGCSQSVERLNQAGNERFSQQAFTEALQAYEAAQIKSPELAEPYYNAANALYRQGNYEQALAEMQEALSYADQDQLRSSGYFNLGNTAFNQGEMEGAIGAYIETLLLSPEDMEAKYNLELALQEQSQQESEDNQSDDSGSETEPGGSNDQEPSENGSSNDDQEGEKPGNPNSQDQGEEKDSSENEGSQAGQGDQNRSESETDDTKSEGGQNESGNQTDELGQQLGEQDSEDRNPASPKPAPGQRMTTEQAKQLLAAIAQDAQTLQEKLGQILFVQAPPPAQDW
jgi:tetratricopeptide (TPR) repeat protein